MYQYRHGLVILGSSPEIIAAHEALIEGAKSGASKETLRPHLNVLKDAEERALLLREWMHG